MTEPSAEAVARAQKVVREWYLNSGYQWTGPDHPYFPKRLLVEGVALALDAHAQAAVRAKDEEIERLRIILTSAMAAEDPDEWINDALVYFQEAGFPTTHKEDCSLGKHGHPNEGACDCGFDAESRARAAEPTG